MFLGVPSLSKSQCSTRMAAHFHSLLPMYTQVVIIIVVVVGCWLVAVAPLFSLVFALLSPFSCVLTLWLFIPYRQRLSELLLVRDVAMDALSRCEAIFCSLLLPSNEVCTEQDLPAPIHLPEHMLSQLLIGCIGCVLNWFAGRLSQTLSIF